MRNLHELVLVLLSAAAAATQGVRKGARPVMANRKRKPVISQYLETKKPTCAAVAVAPRRVIIKSYTASNCQPRDAVSFGGAGRTRRA